jgi:pyruvate dehydrogenase E2 component (dihydrolipoamide acetyltransferase)
MDFRLPELGEGIDSATVVAVKVKPGDTVAAGQDVLDVETDKASVPVNTQTAGTVGNVLVKPGDKINVGAPIFTFAGANGATPKAAPAAVSPPPPATKNEAIPTPAPAKSESGPVQAPGKVEMKLPELGEGIDSATVVAIKVKVGDTVAVGQDVLEVETDKASMPVKSEVAGTVSQVSVKQGDKVSVGAVVAIIATSGGVSPAKTDSSPPKPVPNTQHSEAPAVAVSNPAAPPPAPTANGKKDLTPAGPATRRLARQLGVGLAEVRGSGRGGRVTLDDVKGFVRSEREQNKGGGGSSVGGLSGKTVADSFAHPKLPDFSKYGEVEKKPVSKLRETIAKNLTISWRTMPMVTQNDNADITDLEAGRKRIVDSLPKGAAKITWTVLAVKACVAALKEFPNFNSSYDMNGGELILKKYYHIGIAVDTERGLVVPVINDADKKSIREIASEVQSLAEKARTGKLTIDEMRGGTFTITNLGGIGGTSFTPIVNYPEVAILGMCRSQLQPVVKDGQIVPRLLLPLSLTYDHRVIDGADGARFTARLAQLFSDPMRLLMES